MVTPPRLHHPLADLVAEAAAGRFPPVDGRWRRVPPWRDGLEAVVAFTGHAVFAVGDDVADSWLDELGVDGFGGAHDPRVIAALAGEGAWIDSLDALHVSRGTAERGDPACEPRLVPRPDLATLPRARLAAELRDDVEVWGRPRGSDEVVVTVSRGVGGLRELSFEVDPAGRGGAGASLVRDALAVVPAGELVVAAAAPGNAASTRSLLAAGFAQIGSMQLFRPVRQAR